MRQRLLYFFCLTHFFICAQTPVGHWRDHLPYLDGQKVISTDEKVYCVANGNLFYFNKADGSINKMSRVQGLSDIEVSAINYDRELKILVIGYENGNIDLVDKEGVFNIGAIERKTIPGSKRINNIYIKDRTAYLATGFAIVLLSLENKDIKETYYVGENGAKTNIVDITIDDNYIYALQDNNILRADKNSSMLIDFHLWENYLQKDLKNASFIDIEFFNNNLYIIQQVKGYRNDSMFIVDNNQLRFIDFEFETDYYSLKAKGDYLIVSRSWASIVYNSNLERVIMYSLGEARDADFDEDMVGWIAGNKACMVKIDGWNRDTIRPEGPKNIGVFDFCYSKGALWVAGGTPSNPWNNYGIHKFENEKWTTLNIETDTGFNNVPNVTKITVDPKNPERVLGGSYGYGVIEILNDKIVKKYNLNNSIIEPIEGYGDGFYTRIMGMDFDSKGNLFFAVNETKNPFYVLTANGELIHIETKYDGFEKAYIYDLIITSNDHVWVVLKYNGLFLMNLNGTIDDFSDDEELKFNPINQDGKSSPDVTSIAEDREGNIWVGSGSGPYIYYNPGNIFEKLNPEVGSQVKLTDFDGLVQYLLGSERITGIAVDGANRKWLATGNSGAYLLSPDGYKEIYNFTKENSPLVSNTINAVGINDATGEVFFGTDYGIIAFRAEATRGGDDFGKVYVFPNPVREDYDGVITVTGLATDVNVKITDVSGNLVYETTALGGQAIWDGRNFDGKRAHTGVYLVFCTNNDGSKTHVTKLVFIN